MLTGIRRSRATPPRRKAPVLLADLELLLAGFEVQAWPAATGGIRNRCLLLFGWGGALRRSELVALNVSDVRLHREDGLHITLRRSKTDREAAGRVVPIPFGRKPATCAPCAWVRWTALLAAFDGSDGGPGGRVGLLRALRSATGTPDNAHACRGDRLPQLAGDDAPLFPAVRNNGLIGPNRITGEAVNQMIQRAAVRAGPGRPGHRRAQPALWFRHPGVPQRRRRPRHHAPDPPHQPGHPGDLRTGERPAAGQRGHPGRLVTGRRQAGTVAGLGR